MPVHLLVDVPNLHVMDGFGRLLRWQYYKAGSSLEVVCLLDRIPPSWNITDMANAIIWANSLGERMMDNPKGGIRIQNELEGGGILSRMSITQASLTDSGNYTCAVPGYVSSSLSLEIIDKENPAAMAASSSTKVAFNLCCFAISLLAALLPVFTHISSAIVSAVTAKKANHDCHWMLVSTATVLRMPVYQSYLILLVQSSRRPFQCLSLFHLICFAPYFLLPCWC